MDIHTQATLLAAIVLGALAGAALLRDNRPRVFTLFAVFAANLSLFSFADFLHRWPGSRSATTCSSGSRSSRARSRPPRRSPSSSSSSASRAARRAARGTRCSPARSPASSSRSSPLVHVKAAKLVVTVYVRRRHARGPVGALEPDARRADAASSARGSQYLFFGAASRSSLSTLDVLPRFGVPYPLEGLGAITLTLFMFFLSQTLQRQRLLDLHEFLGKIVVVTALGLVLVAIYGGLVSWVGNRPELFPFNTVVASFVILSLFEPLREKVEEWVVATLFRERYELVRQLEQLRDRAAT